jgi:hypothetical protein
LKEKISKNEKKKKKRGRKPFTLYHATVDREDVKWIRKANNTGG